MSENTLKSFVRLRLLERCGGNTVHYPRVPDLGSDQMPRRREGDMVLVHNFPGTTRCLCRPLRPDTKSKLPILHFLTRSVTFFFFPISGAVSKSNKNIAETSHQKPSCRLVVLRPRHLAQQTGGRRNKNQSKDPAWLRTSVPHLSRMRRHTRIYA